MKTIKLLLLLLLLVLQLLLQLPPLLLLLLSITITINCLPIISDKAVQDEMIRLQHEATRTKTTQNEITRV